MKADSARVIVRLLKDADDHGVRFAAPDPFASTQTWTLDDRPWESDQRPEPVIRAGFAQIPGVGDVTAREIIATRAQLGTGWTGWESLLKVKGIGPKTMEKITAWAEKEDPFGVFHAERFIKQIRECIRTGEIVAPMPTHTSQDLVDYSGKLQDAGKAAIGRGRLVTYVGIVAQRDRKDIIEDQRARTGEEPEEIANRIKRPDLTKFATLRTDDGGEEDVYLRFSRFGYRKFAADIDGIEEGKDAVIVRGRESLGFGAAIQVDKMWVISPDD
jgi:DNA polymerase-3 subunit alpha